MPGTSRTILIEFFGIPRARAGVSETTIEISEETVTLGAVLAHLAARFPALAVECIVGEELRDGFAANLRGERFLRAPSEILTAGDTLLIISADAGG